MNSLLAKSLLVIAFSFLWRDLHAQTIRIMPLGNSITYDHNSFDEANPRPEADRISYRYMLYQKLKADGFDFDFVGSENAGNNYFQNSEFDDNAGFPGIESWELANLITTGYNGFTHQYESPGPYLNYYPADIILLHIGTNNLTTSPDQVEDILDNIRLYDPDVIILVARIINRRIYHSSTTTFNNNVELMVHSRGDERIIMINLESGAGINYSADMIDNLHPNQAGYDKMAEKWYSSILSLNEPPVISSIPTQYTDKGEVFESLNLDQYVSDSEDSDFLLAWSYEQNPDSRLTISIDANRLMHVTPDPDWSGSETIKLKVKDSGNGAFPREDSMDVVFVVDHVNTPPVIISSPESNVLQGSNYSYTIVATDEDEDFLSYSSVQIPPWMTFNTSSHKLTGIPEHSDVGLHDVVLSVTDGYEIIEQEFQVDVEDTNDPPVFTSPSESEALEDAFYSFMISATDADGDALSYEVGQIPDWLYYSSQTHTLSGSPTNDDVGVYNITVKISDGLVDVYESLKITVVNVNDLPVFTSTPDKKAGVDQAYIYRVTGSDIDQDDILTFSALQLPGWLNFTTSSKDALIYGTPSASDFGGNLVLLQVSDGKSEVIQAFTIDVSFPSDIGETDLSLLQNVYPNPASSLIHFHLRSTAETFLRVINTSGMVVVEKEVDFIQVMEVDISHLPVGEYFYQIRQNGVESTGKFIKN